MKCSGDSKILHEIVCYTTRISSCFSDFRVVHVTNYFVKYLGIPATLHFLFNSVESHVLANFYSLGSETPESQIFELNNFNKNRYIGYRKYFFPLVVVVFI